MSQTKFVICSNEEELTQWEWPEAYHDEIVRDGIRAATSRAEEILGINGSYKDEVKHIVERKLALLEAEEV